MPRGKHALVGADEKTFRKWSWIVVKRISNLKMVRQYGLSRYFIDIGWRVLIKWENRMKGACQIRHKVSVDVPDCRVRERFPFPSKWYSFKRNGPEVRYEIAVPIISVCIVWIHGLFRCGSFSDLRMFKTKLKSMLQENETVITDRGHKEEKCEYLLSGMMYHGHLYPVIRALHEVFNRRFKQFNSVRTKFRHNLSLPVCASMQLEA